MPGFDRECSADQLYPNPRVGMGRQKMQILGPHCRLSELESIEVGLGCQLLLNLPREPLCSSLEPLLCHPRRPRAGKFYFKGLLRSWPCYWS